jgi:hypothetical protein
MIVEPRLAQIPLVIKQPKVLSTKVRVFKKEDSVFALYIEDTKFIEQVCLEKHDFQKWKCSRFIKEEYDLEKVK